MSSKKETISRLGMGAKGIVYLLIGVLTALAAFGQGGSKSGKDGILKFLAEQSYGKVLLVALGLGLLCYMLYRLYQAFANPKNLDDDTKGYFKRIAYGVSGLIYGFLAYSAIKMAFGSSSGNSGSSSKFLNSEYGNIIAFGIALILLGKAIYEFYVAYSGKFKEDIEHSSIDSDAQSLVIKAGKMGFTARGIVAAIMSFLFVKAGMGSANGDINRADAFSFLQNEFGSIVLGIVAIGVALYGVFMLIKSKYPDTNVR
ncbi:DUF1206 domain-containing protein [Winogradskyella bathintestinalis]|uniref:DUF1206 domain-containing protein n=1 Tax=Winogradskyella bathintestinalis TaxID=3035208 RepID=A0ABT7ZWW9_9FLAO|nr:DUF1206 domain-containing protein [Winogradskyella bathintestinalis]MDN3493500.1 DUF1206 domain-containing protein [Winogradskyella bathintestinalis]